MTAAMIAGSPERALEFDRLEVQHELSQLHIMLLSIKADVDDVLSPCRPPASAIELKRGVKAALARVEALRERLQQG